MSLADRYAGFVTRYSTLVVVLLVIVTAVVGSAAGDVESDLTIAGFDSDSTEAEKLEYVRSNFTTEGENATVTQVVVRGEDVLSKEALLATLRLQQSLRENATVEATLRERQPTVGLANLVAIAAMRGGPPGDGGGADARARQPPGELPPLSAQIDQLESMTPAEIERVLLAVLDPDGPSQGPVDPYTLVSTDYEPGTTTADARVVFVFQRTDGDGSLPESVVESQLATRAIVDDRFGEGGSASSGSGGDTIGSDGGVRGVDDAFVFGAGIVDEEAGRATGDSFAIISPAALLLVLAVLLVAYRDPLDVLLGLVGIGLVLVWMAGFMGWAGIGVTQILISVPFLLIGLSIDYALHVVMRYREANAGTDRLPRDGMRAGLAGVVVALAATTFTTAVGFLSNLVSPIGSIREFGLVSAFGIVAAFVVFAGLLPALKVDLERLLSWLGAERERRAFGTGGAVNRVLVAGARAARRVPLAITVVAVLLAAGGGYAATDIDTSIDQVDFLPRETPEWMEHLPEPFAPGDYRIRNQAVFVNENFASSREEGRVEVLVEGPVTDPDTLQRLDAGRERVAQSDTAVTLANGDPRVTGPVGLIRDVAARNDTVASIVDRADTDGDGIPDRNLEAVYDAVYAAAPEDASAVIHRVPDDDGDGHEYRALRMRVGVAAGADTGRITGEMRDVATTIEVDTALAATATGPPIVDEVVQQGLLRTLVETFLLTLGVIVAFLSVIFYRRYGTLSLGVVTTLPVVCALAWILGTMYLLDIPFNTETAVITSIAIGLGVDYAIHVSERFVEELSAVRSTPVALEATVAGTGGALLASAATTASGFGVLTLALVPSLRRFGLVTGLTIVYAFLASVLVLPSLLVLWRRYVAPAFDPTAIGAGERPRTGD